MDERFLDGNEDKELLLEPNSIEAESGCIDQERKKQLEILEDVLGHHLPEAGNQKAK